MIESTEIIAMAIMFQFIQPEVKYDDDNCNIHFDARVAYLGSPTASQHTMPKSAKLYFGILNFVTFIQIGNLKIHIITVYLMDIGIFPN